LLNCSIVILSRKIVKFTILANLFKKSPFFYTINSLLIAFALIQLTIIR